MPESLYPTGLDSDGDVDLLSASNGDEKIAWKRTSTASAPFPFMKTSILVPALSIDTASPLPLTRPYPPQMARRDSILALASGTALRMNWLLSQGNSAHSAQVL